LFEVKTRGVRAATDGDEDDVGFELDSGFMSVVCF
jgi:hypothetical protein